VQVTFVVIDHEILSTVIDTVPVLWFVQKFQFLAKLKANCTCKLLDSLPRNDALAELCSGKFNVAYCCDPKWKLRTQHQLTNNIELGQTTRMCRLVWLYTGDKDSSLSGTASKGLKQQGRDIHGFLTNIFFKKGDNYNIINRLFVIILVHLKLFYHFLFDINWNWQCLGQFLTFQLKWWK
jgi:hypothetical protein